MAKSVIIALSAIAGIAAGVILEKRTGWFGRNGNSEMGISKGNNKQIDAQVAAGGGLTNEAATGNND